MFSVAHRRRPLLASVASLAATALLTTAPAAASENAAAGAGCPAVPMSQPFSPWSDAADYFLAPDGDLEQGGAGWTLRDGARVVGGSEPFAVTGETGRNALLLTTGSSATTPAFCIGVEHRSMRFFVTGAAAGSLHVDVLYRDGDGTPRARRIATVGGGQGGWAPSDVVPMVVNELAAEQGNAMDVSLRFSQNGHGAMRIDDVHVDPYRGR